MIYERTLEQADYRIDAAKSVWIPRQGASSLNYTDGDAVEARIRNQIAMARDRSVLSMELRQGIVDWPSRYHLSPVRANLLRPLAHLFPDSRILEIGAGCGALTRFMGECGGEVLALEGSLARAEIAALRCQDLPNVTILSDSFQNFPDSLTFDVILFVGVLEYARLFHDTDATQDPVDAMLHRAGKLLSPNGHVVLAIENQLGLKYFAGYAEDHTSTPMYGIEDRYTATGVVTFGRLELAQKLTHAGLTSQQWLYPYPDYKLPSTVLSERAVQCTDPVDLSSLLSTSVVADAQVPARFNFSLEQAWRGVYRNRLAGELANSFLVVASSQEAAVPNTSTLAYHYSVERRPRFTKQLTISMVDDAYKVTSSALAPEADCEVVPLSWHTAGSHFETGDLWLLYLFRLLNEPGWRVADLVPWLDGWRLHLSRHAGVDAEPITLDTRLAGALVDAIPRNLIVAGNSGHFIDLEWTLNDGVCFGHLLYRAVLLSMLAISSVARPAQDQDSVLRNLIPALLARIDYPIPWENLERFHALEQDLQFWIHGSRWIDFTTAANYRLPIR